MYEPLERPPLLVPTADLSRRLLYFGAALLFASLLFIRPLSTLFRLSLQQDDLSYILVIPVLASFIFFIERKSVFRLVSTDFRTASPFVVGSIALAVTTYWAQSSAPPDVQLAGWILAFLLTLTAAFAISFGPVALRAASFPLLYLLLAVPPPNLLLNRVTHILQAGTAALTGVCFDVFQVPALREGFVFHLPQFSIAVAQECSGIRSSIALLIIALPVLHFGIRGFWRKAAFVLCAVLITFVKNAIRIVTLTLLAIHVDTGFLFGRLHHRGGIVFFLIGLLLLLPIYLALQNRTPATPSGSRNGDNSPTGNASATAQIR